MIYKLFLLLIGRGYIFSISSCQPLHAVGYIFYCPYIVYLNTLSQHQSNPQAELSKPTREYFKISRRKRTRSLSEYIPIYQSHLQCDFCISNHLVTRPVTKGRPLPTWKNFLTSEKMFGHIDIWVCIQKDFFFYLNSICMNSI